MAVTGQPIHWYNPLNGSLKTVVLRAAVHEAPALLCEPTKMDQAPTQKDVEQDNLQHLLTVHPQPTYCNDAFHFAKKRWLPPQSSSDYVEQLSPGSSSPGSSSRPERSPHWVTSTATLAETTPPIIVEGACLIICGILFGIYSTWVLRRVKLIHHKEINERDLENGDASIEKGGQEERYPELEKGKTSDVVEDKNKGEITEERVVEEPTQESAQDHVMDNDMKEATGMEATKAEEPIQVDDKVDQTDRDEGKAVELKSKVVQPGQEPANLADSTSAHSGNPSSTDTYEPQLSIYRSTTKFGDTLVPLKLGCHLEVLVVSGHPKRARLTQIDARRVQPNMYSENKRETAEDGLDERPLEDGRNQGVTSSGG
ncbi:9135_t:CDS:2 [Acaulospora colombiana]|uniref:9135_t:CDS:1 n=1 Tax=Acaulospora colombiana TaxID=27376 RepID=A0ACA9MBW9_9GLOM|nr:9135_t:CDS:2 [Acaulospora colombiana]